MGLVPCAPTRQQGGSISVVLIIYMEPLHGTLILRIITLPILFCYFLHLHVSYFGEVCHLLSVVGFLVPQLRGAGRAAAGYGEPVAACPQGPSTENINLFQSRQTALQISQGD